MKAITFDDFGAADVLRLAEVPMPEVRPSDLLVKVHAAGVNRADLLQRQGYYGRQSYGESDLLGLEVAGEVIAVGADVTDIRPGERVMGIVGGGAYAEFARVDHGMAVPVPEDLNYIGAAAVMESFVTAWEAAVHLGGTARGTSVLIHAAAGGVGSAGVAIAHALGARVFATANAERRTDVLALGAEVARLRIRIDCDTYREPRHPHRISRRRSARACGAIAAPTDRRCQSRMARAELGQGALRSSGR